ncbi:unnamed protein product [Strongylus vulgaris]|uniref:SXP/RAL-2 family protein Ani s 5-like cation-binding domain-containing protein n=1 Tax=Strongylus vulgaris TaxID=40348 RepID=A0A3P7I928_STRVU|nr:unnamed protein product [Strongylus vulgaris]
MLKLFVLLTIAVVICSKKEREFKDIPGVSAANMDKLRQLMTPHPESRKEFREKMKEWMDGLPEDEKKAAEAHRDEIKKKFKALHRKNETETTED